MQIRELKEKAQALYTRGKYLKSREHYEEVLLSEPNDAQLHLRLAECCRRLGDVQAAASYFSKASRVLLSAGHAARAQAAMKLALELKPRDATLLERLREIEAVRRPLDAQSERARTPEKFGNSARALSLEVPIVFEDPETVSFDIDEDFSLPPIADEPVVGGAAFVRLSEHIIAVRTGATWTLFKSDTAIREEELTEEALEARLVGRPSK